MSKTICWKVSVCVLVWRNVGWFHQHNKHYILHRKFIYYTCEALQGYGRPFVSKLWHDILAFFSHVYLQSFLLHDIPAFLCHIYLCFIPKYMTTILQTRIYMRTKKPIYIRYKQACGIWGHRKSSYKRERIIPSAKNPFMYDGAEK